MQKFEFKKEKITTGENAPLPAGGYVAKILNAEESSNDHGVSIIISFDIIEGEHTEHFRKQYLGSQYEDKKWKGNYYLPVPDEKSKYPESQKKKFGNFIACVEESNKGYSWNWDVKSLKDKKIGVIFGNVEYDFNGHRGWTTKCKSIATVEDIQQGKFVVPKDKPLGNTSNEALSPDIAKLVTDVKGIEDQLPF